MSRLIVKNLPNKVTEDKIRDTFSSLGGVVTDVQLKFTKEGAFRHFGFVGFKTDEEAEKAKSYFNGTFIGACKIKVETCADIGDASKPRAWSKYASDSSKYKEIHDAKNKSVEEDAKKVSKEKKKKKSREVKDLFEKYKDDAKFQEFLRVNKKNWLEEWNNDAILKVGKSYQDQNKEEIKDEDESEGGQEEEEEKKLEVAKDEKVSDLDYLNSKKLGTPQKEKKEPKNEVYFTVKVSGLPYKVKKKHLKEFFKPLKAKSIRVPQKIKGIAYVGFADEKDGKKAMNKNKSFIEGHQVQVKHYKNQSGKLESKTESWEKEHGITPADEQVGESGRIFVRNLNYTVTEDDLEQLFKTFGPLTEVNLPIDRVTRKVKGFAFITYVIPENASRAFEVLDGTSFQGRLLHLIPGKMKPGEEEPGSGEGSSFKQKKAKELKKSANSSHNWNTLFLGSSAVADIMSETYNVSKSDVLSSDGKQSAAVRLALGETQIVSETRNFLESEGISLDSFSKPAKERSKVAILVKNLPHKTSVEEIRDTFAKYGELGRVVLPPRCVTAIVEFLEPTEARHAFRSLAYTKFRNTPLYLEWAPKDSFSRPQPPPSTSQTPVQSLESTTPSNSILFVKNLNFSTLEEELKDHFSQVGEVSSVTISKKKDVKRPGEMLSMGYGFVHFKTSADADKALKELQRKVLDGHCLELKRSNRAPEAAENKPNNFHKSSNLDVEPTAKILVRNIPFEANVKEVEDIFKTFGTLKSVRLPKKVTGSHRGFAFVEYNTVEEAKKAFETVCHSTHLYGRRLVLEWSAQEETIEDLRKKTASQVIHHEAPPSKRVKKSKFMETLVMTAP